MLFAYLSLVLGFSNRILSSYQYFNHETSKQQPTPPFNVYHGLKDKVFKVY